MPGTPMNARERALVWLFRASGGILLLAVPAIFLPVDQMAEYHRRLGLGEFPASPLVDYLTRSLSGMYAIQGALLLVLARDLRRSAPVVVFMAWAGVAFGVAMIGIDLHAGMPAYWALLEGPAILLLAVLVLWLARGVQQDRR